MGAFSVDGCGWRRIHAIVQIFANIKSGNSLYDSDGAHPEQPNRHKFELLPILAGQIFARLTPNWKIIKCWRQKPEPSPNDCIEWETKTQRRHSARRTLPKTRPDQSETCDYIVDGPWSQEVKLTTQAAKRGFEGGGGGGGGGFRKANP